MIKNFQNLSLSHDIHPRHIIEKQLKPKGEKLRRKETDNTKSTSIKIDR